MRQKRKNNGFTVVEMMMALATAGIVMAAIYTTYQVQVRGKRSQEMITDMQQGARAAITIMEREIRLAGCDPTGSAKAGVLLATPSQLEFTMDVCDSDGNLGSNGIIDGPYEKIIYALNNDDDENGIADGFPCELGRDIGGKLQPVCENVEVLNFVYRGRNLEDPPLNPDSNADDLEKIRYVEIAMVIRSGERVFGSGNNYKNTTEYRNLNNDVILPAQNDNVMRMLFTTRIFCRNIDLDVVLN